MEKEIVENDNDLLFDDSNDDFLDDNNFSGFGDSSFGGEAPISKHADLLKELTNFDPAIKTRIRNWLGLEWDDTLKEYKQKQEAIINEKGARWCIGFLQNYQAKTNIITNINEREMKNLQLDIIKLVWMVFPTRDDFEVNATADWYRLCTELEHAAFLVLAGAGDGKYTKFLGESVTRTESVNLNPETRQPMKQPNNNMLDDIKNKLLGRGQ